MKRELHQKSNTYPLRPPHHVVVRVLDGGWLRLTRWHYDTLAAPFWRFYWNASQGASVLLGDKHVALTPSQCLVIPPQTPFSTRLAKQPWHLCIHFMTTPSSFQLAPGLYSVPIQKPLRRRIDELTTRLRVETTPSLRTSMLSQAIIQEALLLLPEESLVYEQRDERLTRVLRLMETHLSNPLPVMELARRCGMHANTFIRFFRKVMGQTPQHYCNGLRIERAVLLLITSPLSIKEIAEETGFCDRYHFSHVFTRHYGIGPAQFRLKHGGSLPPTPASAETS